MRATCRADDQLPFATTPRPFRFKLEVPLGPGLELAQAG
jgi:hypothetical protein